MLSILLATCLTAPLYLDIGPCDVTPCRCTDLVWDASQYATSYEVQRQTASTGDIVNVGVIVQQCSDWECSLFTSWSTLRDSESPFSYPPHEGVDYLYRVRACNSFGCSDWTLWLANQGWPLACYVNGREESCYVGDDVISR